jgi:hypothetical protein
MFLPFFNHIYDSLTADDTKNGRQNWGLFAFYRSDSSFSSAHSAALQKHIFSEDALQGSMVFFCKLVWMLMYLLPRFAIESSWKLSTS